MIFRRALQREFGNLLVAVFAVLLAVVLTSLLVRILGRAAGGKIPGEAVLAIIGFTALNLLPKLLGVALFVSLLIALARSYRDSEMVVWFASGVPLTAWIRPVLAFAAPIVVVIAVLSLFLSPWALLKSDMYRTQLEAQSEVSRIAPGVFLESPGADRVFFVEAVPNDPESVQNIFVAFTQRDVQGVVVARRGFIETAASGDKYAVLLNGRRYDGVPGTAEYRVMEFERYALRIEANEARRDETEPKMKSTLELLRSPSREGEVELTWRISHPLMALILAILAIPLAFVNPRSSNSRSFLLAVLIYISYSNVLSVVQTWARQGKLPVEVGVWSVHGAMVALAIGLFVWRMTLWRLPRFRR